VTGPIVPGGISCRELVELVTDYLDGALAPDVHARLETHLEACDPCRVYVEQIRTTQRLAAAAESELEHRPDRDALLAAFHEFRRGAGPQ
jgi:anti-sigma factor RsiW